MYRITGEELDQLRYNGNLKALDLAFFTLCVGILVSLLITLKTVAIADPITHADFVGCAAVAGLGVVVFGIRGLLAWRDAQQALEKLKSTG